ncbi:unnamed protein product [Closterium sp. NIES-53]
MASLRVFTFDHEGRLIQFDTWLDDLQLYLLSDSRDSVSLFDHTSGASLAPPATADSATRSHWLTRAAGLPHKTAKAQYDAVVALYSSPTTAALGRLVLPYMFPELSAFATVQDLVAHLRTSDARYRAALPAEDHFLALDPTDLTVDLLEQDLLAVETSVVAVGAARGTPRMPFFEGCPPSPLAPSYASAAAAADFDILGAEDVGAASASGKRAAARAGVVEVVAAMGVVAGVGALVAAVVAAVGVAVVAAVGVVAVGLELLSGERGASGGSASCPYVIRTGDRAGQTCGKPHTQHRCFSRLDDAWRADFGDEVERPCGAELLRSGVDVFALDYDAILAAMYALSVIAEGDCYHCVPPGPEGPVLARSSTVLLCPAILPGSLSGLHLPSFSTNLRVSICTCTRTGRHLAMFTRRPGSSLYTLTTEPPQVAASAQVSASGPVAPPCSCCLLTHQTLLWHHRLGHPSLPRLHGMHSRLLVSGLPRSLPPLPPSSARPCLPCVEGRQSAAPHSSSFLPTIAPLQTLHMDVWGPARVSGQGRERYFLVVVYDYTRCTTVFPLRSKSVHASGLPQQNGIAERRIGLVMEVARTSMIHAAAPHLLWPFAVWYAAHQLNLWPRVSLPETSPTLRWTGKVDDASVFRDVSFDESVPFYHLFPYRSAPPPPLQLFLAPGPPPLDPLPPQGPAPSGVSQVDPLIGTVRVEVAVDTGAAGGAVFGGAASGGSEPARAEPGGAESEGAESVGAKPRGTASSGGPAGASPRLSPRLEPLSLQQLRQWFDRHTRLWSGAGGAGDFAAGGTGAGGTGATRLGGARTRGTKAARDGGAGGAGAIDPGAGGAGAGGDGAGDPGAQRLPFFVPPPPSSLPPLDSVLCQILGLPSSTDLSPSLLSPPPHHSKPQLQPDSPLPSPSPYAEQTDSFTKCREPESRPALPVRAVPTGRRVPCPRPPVPGNHAMALRPSSVPLRVPLSPPPESSLLAIPDPESDLARAASPTVTRLLATVVTDPSFESTTVSSLVAELVDFAAASRLDYATSIVAESESDCPPSVEGECALGTDVLEDRQEDFECRVAALPHLVAMLLALEGDTNAPDIPTPRSYAEAITGTYSSQWQTAMDAEMASWKSTGTYVVPSSGANIVDGMWIFRVKRPPGSPPVFKACYREYELHSLDFSTAFLQGSLHEAVPPTLLHWVVSGRTTLAALGFAPSTTDPSLFLRTGTLLPPFYVLVYVLQRFGFTYSSPQSTPLPTSHSLSAPPSDESVEPSGPYPELVGCLMYLMACTRPDLAYPHSILARHVAPGRHRPEHWEAAKMVLRYLCSTSGMELVLGGRGPVVLTGHADASSVDDLATQRTSQGYTFSLGSSSVSWRSTRSSSILSSSCEAEIYAGAMAAQELRWLTYLLTDLGERPRSSSVLYVDKKAMIALCQEHKLEHRTKHIALCYFLARELQERGQLCLAYVATTANTADIFTKALQSGEHQRFSTDLGLLALLFLTGLGKATADSLGPPPAAPTTPSAVTSVSATLVDQLVARINALESHQAMSIDGSSYTRGVVGLPLHGEDRRINSERSFTVDNRQASAPAQDSQQQVQPEAIATLQTKFVLTSKLKTSTQFAGKDFYTWSFEFELLATTAQIWMYHYGSLPFPLEGTIHVKHQYYHESLLAYTTLLRNLSLSEQLDICSYKSEWAPAYASWEHLKNS